MHVSTLKFLLKKTSDLTPWWKDAIDIVDSVIAAYRSKNPLKLISVLKPLVNKIEGLAGYEKRAAR